MKIYEIGTGYTPIPAQIGAATEIVEENLTRALRKQNIPAEIIDIRAKDRGATDLPIHEVWVPGCFSGTDIRLSLLHKLKRVVYSVCLAAKLQRVLKAAEETVVLHFHNQYNMFFFLLLVPKRLRKRALTAYTNHTGIWQLPWDETERIVKKRYFQEAACMKRADLVFALNKETAENVNVHLGVPGERIALIANGVDTDIYCPLARKGGEKFSLGGKNVILQVGSVCDNKGQLRAVEQLLPLLKADRNLVYAYAGGIVDEKYQDKIDRTAKENGLTEQVRYLGMVKPGGELNELYNAASATLLLSKQEAFGLVAAESMAAGVPVLMDDRCPARFEKGCVRCDLPHLAETARKLCAEASAQLRTEARAYAVNYYSWDAVAAAYLREFKNGMKKYDEET